MKDFPIQFPEVHWEKSETRTPAGGTKVDYFVQELEDAKRDCKPVILIIYSRQEGEDMTAEEWNLIARFFEAKTELTDLAGDGTFALYGMNRRCGCWAKAPMRVDRPMIILFDHKGKVVKRITDPSYPFERMVQDLREMREKAIRDCGQRNGTQETGER